MVIYFFKYIICNYFYNFVYVKKTKGKKEQKRKKEEERLKVIKKRMIEKQKKMRTETINPETMTEKKKIKKLIMF